MVELNRTDSNMKKIEILKTIERKKVKYVLNFLVTFLMTKLNNVIKFTPHYFEHSKNFLEKFLSLSRVYKFQIYHSVFQEEYSFAIACSKDIVGNHHDCDVLSFD